MAANPARPLAHQQGIRKAATKPVAALDRTAYAFPSESSIQPVLRELVRSIRGRRMKLKCWKAWGSVL